jgi:serine protease AprX
MDHARKVVGAEGLGGKLDGDGEIVGVIDSGVDSTHPDLTDRVLVAEAVAGLAADDHVGHGTHVAGSIAGTGKASKGKLRGMAPAAKIVSLAMLDAQGVKDPPDLGDVLGHVADHGAKIINLSWGTPLDSVYDNGSMAVDKWVLDHPDVLVVVAAGNSGRAPEGYPELFTIGTPATAKNALTVGASASSRKAFKDTWGGYKPELYPAEPTKDERMAGDPDTAAALSSRGPTDFQTVKPDLLAPGTHILAPRAAHAMQSFVWRDEPKHGGRYVYLNGTSMATPIVSGAAALVRQFLREEKGVAAPSAALLKAVLVNSAEMIPWHRPEDEQPDFGYPDFDQGFGRLDLRRVLSAPAAPAAVRLSVVDVANDSDQALESRARLGAVHKAARRYAVEVEEGSKEPLRVTLVWTDHQHSSLQNALSLRVETPEGRMLLGNADHRWQRVPAKYLPVKLREASADTRNNVQTVHVEKPRAGRYEIRVLARNTLFPPQGFGLSACGGLAGEVAPAA